MSLNLLVNLRFWSFSSSNNLMYSANLAYNSFISSSFDLVTKVNFDESLAFIRIFCNADSNSSLYDSKTLLYYLSYSNYWVKS